MSYVPPQKFYSMPRQNGKSLQHADKMKQYNAYLIVTKFFANEQFFYIILKNRFGAANKKILNQKDYDEILTNAALYEREFMLGKKTDLHDGTIDLKGIQSLLINDEKLILTEANVYRVLFDKLVDFQDFKDTVGIIRKPIHDNKYNYINSNQKAYSLSYRFSLNNKNFYVPIRLPFKEYDNLIITEDKFKEMCYIFLKQVFNPEDLEEEFMNFIANQNIVVEDIDPIEGLMNGRIPEDDFYIIRDNLNSNN